MRYTDKLYGEFNITEPVIIDLINSASLLRLKDIDQAGYRPLWVNLTVDIEKYEHSRFAHSLGVCLLLRKYGASIEEQIAGLIHDVSHSVFSHCVDYALDEGSEKEHDYQDKLFDSYVRKTEIADIIKNHGFDLEYILNEKNFPLKERNLPDLCADRIDYSLRGALIFEGSKDIEYILDNLTAENNNWVFKNYESAKKHAELFFKMNKKYYSGLSSAILLRIVGDCLKYALKNNFISKEDLFTTDELIVKKIEKYIHKDKKLKTLFDRMNNKMKVVNDPENYDVKVFCKSRAVDPLFKEKGKIKKLSEADPEWGNIVKEELKPKQYFLRIKDENNKD